MSGQLQNKGGFEVSTPNIKYCWKRKSTARVLHALVVLGKKKNNEPVLVARSYGWYYEKFISDCMHCHFGYLPSFFIIWISADRNCCFALILPMVSISNPLSPIMYAYPSKFNTKPSEKATPKNIIT